MSNCQLKCRRVRTWLLAWVWAGGALSGASEAGRGEALAAIGGLELGVAQPRVGLLREQGGGEVDEDEQEREHGQRAGHHVRIKKVDALAGEAARAGVGGRVEEEGEQQPEPRPREQPLH